MLSSYGSAVNLPSASINDISNLGIFHAHIHGSVQDCNNAIASALELLQFSLSQRYVGMSIYYVALHVLDIDLLICKQSRGLI